MSRARRRPRPDETDQRAVLALLIAESPIQLTVADLIGGVAAGRSDFPKTDRVERAVHDLTAVGLIHREGETARPTRAALRFDRLFVDND